VACKRIAHLKSVTLTAAHSKEILLKRVQSERYLISYDNMNFYHNTTAQFLHNRSYQVNWTAGYILFMGIIAPIPSASVNYQNMFEKNVDAILPDDELQLYM
jgi:hypothetical protein